MTIQVNKRCLSTRGGSPICRTRLIFDGNAMNDSADHEVECPICQTKVPESSINRHIDNNCKLPSDHPVASPSNSIRPAFQPAVGTGFFSKAGKKRPVPSPPTPQKPAVATPPPEPSNGAPPPKKVKRNAAEEAQPLAERMRPKSLEELVGHEDLVGENGVLRELILTDRVPSMILWAGPGVRPLSLINIP
jgi:putative ATPase